MEAGSIGMIGGTGPQGRGLAMRLAMAGLAVRVGSRSAERAQGIASELNEQVQATGATGATPLQGDANAAVVAASELVLLTVPFENAAETLAGLADSFHAGQIFVDVTVPLDFGKGDVQLVRPPEGSGSQHLRTILPEVVPFCGACKTLPAHVLEELATPLDCDTFVFADNKEAKVRVMETLGRVPGLRPLDVGGMSAAATVEGMTALLIRINKRMKSRHGRFRVVGVGE